MENEKDLIERYKEAIKDKKTAEQNLIRFEEIEKIKREDLENKKKILFDKYSVTSMDEIKKLREDKINQLSTLVEEINLEFGGEI